MSRDKSVAYYLTFKVTYDLTCNYLIKKQLILDSRRKLIFFSFLNKTVKSWTGSFSHFRLVKENTSDFEITSIL